MTSGQYKETIHNFYPSSALIPPENLKGSFKKVKSGWPELSPSEIKRIREASGLSQLQFCMMYGFSLQSLQRWETGKRVPDQMSNLLLRMIDADPRSIYQVVHRVRETV